MRESISELDAFLASDEADFGMTARARQLFSELLAHEDDPFKYFVKILLSAPTKDKSEEESNSLEEIVANSNRKGTNHAVISYRAMKMLKQDLPTSGMGPSILIKNPEQAGLLAKDLLNGLSDVSSGARYSTFHIRELLDSLLEAYPEKVMSAAAAGGKQGVQDHLSPLMTSDQTLSILTHLVCYGCTGRKGIASAEKSAQHTAMYHHLANDSKSKISLGQRRKFVKAIADFQLMEQLAEKLTLTGMVGADGKDSIYPGTGEEICESILTILEVVGYPPAESAQQAQQNVGSNTASEVSVGEDVLLAPLASGDWWKGLLETICNPTCSTEQREAIARTCNQAFALSTGSSSRICKSHAPATDATEQTSEDIVEEKEEKIVNRLVEYGLTEKIHAALVTQLPLLVKALNLPGKNILDFQATTLKDDPGLGSGSNFSVIRHPGRYQTTPLGSWRLQLLALFKEIISYRGTGRNENKGGLSRSTVAMDAVMMLPVPSEVAQPKKGKASDEENIGNQTGEVDNPWPALCSFLWAYPNNDLYHIVFFQMLQAAVLEHHEPTLRLVLQKSKFLTKAVRSFVEPGPLRGVLLDCLNVIRLRGASLPPSNFLPQYLASHDGWKESLERLIELTTYQQTPIKSDDATVRVDLGSSYAARLGFAGISEWDGTIETTKNSQEQGSAVGDNEENKGSNNKKKKNKKKKKKVRSEFDECAY